MKVCENSYVTIQAFMVNDLHLSGNELIVYAVIFGLTQDGSWFYGSAEYLSGWCQVSENTIYSNLKKLCEKGLLEKRSESTRNGKRCEYRPTQHKKLGLPNTRNL